MAMQGRTDWLAANDHPKRHLEAPTREWTRPRGETWYRRTPPAAAGRRTGAATEAGSRHLLVTASRVAGCGVYILDSPTDVIPTALAYLGLDPNSTEQEDFDKAEELLLSIRPHVRKFHSS